MARVIAVYNVKGGVGKTTTAVNLAAYLAVLGKKVLLIDFDPQFNATASLDLKHKTNETVYHALFDNQSAAAVIKPTLIFNFHAIPASPDLAGILVELAVQPNREQFLRSLVNQVRNDYDFVLIDMPPSLSLLTINGLVAADELIVPVQCEYYSLEGLNQLNNALHLIRQNLGHPLKVAGTLVTMSEPNHPLAEDIFNEIKNRFPSHIYKSVIPRSQELAEAPMFKRLVLMYDPKGPGARAYEELAKEVIAQNNTLDSGYPNNPQF